MEYCVREMLHRFRAIEDAKAAHRWISAVVQVEKLCKASSVEG
jgi:hypothetical protein